MISLYRSLLLFSLLAFFLALPTILLAQPTPPEPGQKQLGAEAKRQTLSLYQVRHTDITRDRRIAVSGPIKIRRGPRVNHEFEKDEYRREHGDTTVDRPGNPSALRGLNRGAVGAGISVDLDFESIDLAAMSSLTGFVATPPDTMGAVGPTQFFTALNMVYRVHDKATGTADTSLDVIDSDFWIAAVDPNDSGGGDPRVRFDRINNRWVVIAFTTNPLPNNRILIALSDGPTISLATIWTQYYVTPRLTNGGLNDRGCFADYPMLGIDANAIYLGANMFDQTPLSLEGCGGAAAGATNSSVFVVPLNGLPVLGGDASSATTAFTGLLSSVPIITPMPADNMDPAATTGYVIGHNASSDTQLELGKISNPAGPPGAPTITWTTITVNNKNDGFSSDPSPIGPGSTSAFKACGVPYVGLTSPGPCRSTSTVTAGEWGLDPLGFRPIGGALVRNGKLWTAMTSSVLGPSGALVLWPDVGDRHSVVFFEIDVANSTKVQEGNVFDATTLENTVGSPTSPLHVWMGSVAVNGQGHAVVGATGADTDSTAPSGAWAARRSSDPAGAFSEPAVFHPGIDTGDMRQPFESSDRRTRWGDYAQVTVDPCDDMTFYSIAQYQDSPVITGASTFPNYGLAVARILSAPPAFTSATDAPMGDLSTTITVTGADFYDPPIAGMPPCRQELSATSSTVGVVVNGVTFSSPTEILIDLNTVLATPGAASLVVTNPDGQDVTVPINLVIATDIFADGFESGDTTSWQ